MLLKVGVRFAGLRLGSPFAARMFEEAGVEEDVVGDSDGGVVVDG